MYLDIQKDPERDKRTSIIIFIICVMFMLTAATCSGQCIERLKDTKNTVTRLYPCEGLYLAKGQDTTYFGIFTDSVSATEYYVRMYAYIPEKYFSERMDLQIDFDGFCGTEILYPDKIETSKHYIEFLLTESQVVKVIGNNYRKITLRKFGVPVSCTSDKNTYFADFFAAVWK